VTATERHGHSTRVILKTVAYTDDQIDTMIDSKVASLGWSTEHLPSDQGYALTVTAEKASSVEQLYPELLNIEEFEAEHHH
jgi:hypothetical protein